MRTLFSAVLALLVSLVVLEARGDEGALQVGSKRFTESFLLAEIAAGFSEAAGDRVTLREGLGGTAIVFRALEEGSIDVYPEYTGTVRETILGGAAPGDLASLRRALGPRGIGVSDPLGFENTYALVVPRHVADGKGIHRVSDLAAHPELRIALSHEFLGRPDGWPGLAARYGLTAKAEGMDHGLAYEALAAGRVDAVDAYSTDAKLKKYDLVALEDDRRFFPSYDAVFLYRLEVPRRFPRAWAAIAKLSGSIDAATMIDLNSEVELDGRPFADVARAYVAHVRGGEPTARDATHAAPKVSEAARLARSALRHGPRHLFLVGVSLALSTVAGVLLGILASRSRRWGVPILSTIALVQTVPALALLCFMIPLFGIGVVPTLAALFLYGLLPIVRNTYAGLAEIPPHLREASAALGLSPWARLVSIELPLASRLILAGIKTSAILAVGTATVAAFIGAGGFGEPIAVGLNLNDTRTILDGAIPAALLALAVEAGFAGMERLVVPRGLRLGAERARSS